MDSQKNIIIHVGLPKTASTFLQKKIFPKIENCEAYTYYLAGEKENNIFNKIIKGICSAFYIDLDKTSSKKEYKKFLETNPTQNIILSNEIICGAGARLKQVKFNSIQETRDNNTSFL